MAFEPKRLTHPEGKLGDVVATTAVDYSNFRFRDGYVVAEDQSNLEADSGEAEVDSEKSAPASTETAASANSKRPVKGSADADKGKATDATGATVQTA